MESVQKLSHIEHVLKRPDSYVGPVDAVREPYWVLSGKKFKKACVYVGFVYYLALFTVWHIPSLSTELAFNNFYGSYYGMLNFLIPPHELNRRLFEKAIDKIE